MKTRLKKATIFGGHGFIGRHLASRLRESGCDCVLPERNERLEGMKDLGNVFYCAGLTADYSQRPAETVEAHVCLLSRIMHNCDFTSLVYLSSTRIYDSQRETVGTEEQSLLFQPSNPRHIYDLSKALGESLCNVMGRGKARIARLSCVYNDHTDPDGFLPQLLQRIVRDRPKALEVDSSPYFSRDYIHLDDVLDAMVMIAEKGTDLIYNVASGENTSNMQLFDSLAEFSGSTIVPLRLDEPAPPPRISIARMQRQFDWRPVPVLAKIETILKENLR